MSNNSEETNLNQKKEFSEYENVIVSYADTVSITKFKKLLWQMFLKPLKEMKN